MSNSHIYRPTKFEIKFVIALAVAFVIGVLLHFDNMKAQEIVPSTTSPSSWVYTYYNNNRYTEARSVVSTSDGGYIVAGVTSAFRQPDDFFLTKVSSTGINQWQKVIDYGYFDVSVVAIRDLPDSEEYIALISLSDDQTVVGVILRVDDSGNILWQKKLDVNGSSKEYLNGMIITQSGDILIVGTVPVNSQDMNGLVVKVSRDGTVLWAKSYDNSYTENLITTVTSSESLDGVIESSDGSIVAVGSIVFDKGDKKERSRDSWIIKLDPSGTLLWQKSIGKLEDEFGHGSIEEYAESVIETSDGQYMVVGKSTRTKGPYPTCSYNTGYVYRVDSHGQLVWQKEYVTLIAKLWGKSLG